MRVPFDEKADVLYLRLDDSKIVESEEVRPRDFATIDPADARDLSKAVRAFVHACGELLQRLAAET